MRFAFLTLMLLTSPALADEHNHEHLAEHDGLRVVHPWAPASHGDEAMVYMEIENTRSEAVEILGAQTEIAEAAHLVGFALKDGEAVHEHLPAIPVPAGTEMEFAPDGLAFELHELTEPLHEGESFEMTLQTSLGPIEMIVAVEKEGAHQHSHAGHSH